MGQACASDSMGQACANRVSMGGTEASSHWRLGQGLATSNEQGTTGNPKGSWNTKGIPWDSKRVGTSATVDSTAASAKFR